MVDVAEKTEQIDREETPQSRQRKKLSKEATARKASAKIEDSWYEIKNGKLSKVTVTGTGNTHRVYQCNADKKNKDFVDGLRKKGLIRA